MASYGLVVGKVVTPARFCNKISQAKAIRANLHQTGQVLRMAYILKNFYVFPPIFPYFSFVFYVLLLLVPNATEHRFFKVGKVTKL